MTRAACSDRIAGWCLKRAQRARHASLSAFLRDIVFRITFAGHRQGVYSRVADNRAIKSQLEESEHANGDSLERSDQANRMTMSSDEAGLPEREAKLAAASAAQQRVIKRAWKLKLSAERVGEAEKRAKNLTNWR